MTVIQPAAQVGVDAGQSSLTPLGSMRGPWEGSLLLGPFLRAFLPAGGGRGRRRAWRLFGPLHLCPGVATGPRAGALGIGPESGWARTLGAVAFGGRPPPQPVPPGLPGREARAAEGIGGSWALFVYPQGLPRTPGRALWALGPKVVGCGLGTSQPCGTCLSRALLSGAARTFATVSESCLGACHNEVNVKKMNTFPFWAKKFCPARKFVRPWPALAKSESKSPAEFSKSSSGAQTPASWTKKIRNRGCGLGGAASCVGRSSVRAGGRR